MNEHQPTKRSKPDSTRPNIVLIVTDQHRRDHLGRLDERFVTPHLDRLAGMSMVFERAVVANPICMPNRATLATGRMPSVHGTRFNGLPLDDRATTFMQSLADAGYRTGLIGKLHLQNMGDHPEIAAAVVDRTLHNDAVSMPPSGWDSWELKTRYDDPNGEHDIVPGWYGFEHAELAIDHGDVVGGHYALWLRDQGVDPLAIRGKANAVVTDETWSEIRQPAVKTDLYHSAWVGKRSAAFIEADDPRPYFIQVSFPDPHHPFTPPGDRYHRYDHRSLEPPKSFFDSHVSSMPHLQRLTEKRGHQGFHLSAFAPTVEQYQRALAAEIATIELIDEAVGEVLAAVERAGDNTIVIFTSDHGDMFGDHGLMLKTAMHYRAVLEVPLFIAGPGITQGRSHSLVSTLDLAQTICALAGVEPFWGMQGHDLTPILREPAAQVRDHVLVEEDQLFDLAGLGQPLRMRTIVTRDTRLTRYAGSSSGELYDLTVDPEEMHNLDADPSSAELRAVAMEHLADSLADHADRDRRPAFMA